MFTETESNDKKATLFLLMARRSTDQPTAVTGGKLEFFALKYYLTAIY